MINILLNGALGRMGKEVIHAVDMQSDKFRIVCGVDKEEDKTTFPIYNNIDNINEKVDVIIDFSIPSASFAILEYAKKHNIPAVIATTGFSNEDIERIKEYSKTIPVFRSSNMSLDINLMASIVKKVAEVLKNSDIEIIETHHNRKIDSPSGTAILLADAINEVLEDKKQYNFDRMQKKEKRSRNEIGFSSIRGGNVVGEHTVAFFGESETLEITHKAYSRQVFAEGALKAAEFIVGKESGLYDMGNIV